MKLHLLENRQQKGYTTFGSVWEKGEVSTDSFLLKNGEGEQVPVQTRVTAWWPDGSIKWAAHTVDAQKAGKTAVLEPADAAESDRGSMERTPEKACCEDFGESIKVIHTDGFYKINTGLLSLKIPCESGAVTDCMAESVQIGGKAIVSQIVPVLYLEHRKEYAGENRAVKCIAERVGCMARIHQVKLEEEGNLQCVVCFKGAFREEGRIEEIMPFTIRMYLSAGSGQMRFVHTFFFHGEEKGDFLKGMGIRFDTLLEGDVYQRHIKFGTDRQCFHEVAVLLNSNYPRLSQQLLREQMNGILKDYGQEQDVADAVRNLPEWNYYSICQDSPSHFRIQKRTEKECCYLTCQQGQRAPGTMAVHGKNGGIVLGIRDFWQKYPSGLSVDGLGGNLAQCTAWFYCPEAEAYDFRHYDTRSYPLTSYEGYPELGADPNGISVTSECMAEVTEEMFQEKQMTDFADMVRKPAVYVGDPEYYHEKEAFGFWGLVSRKTEVENWIEDQLDRAVDFYLEEVENRNWYGLFDYGDFMHTYDSIRHCWRYDMGGFAWQNTELVPTYWLWYCFLRTGREDVFTLAEAMSRHCSEVDLYHFGPMKGIGSRHNVRHWGCSCKEPRVSMAGHHRFYYYLLGEHRMGEVLDEVKDADESMNSLTHFLQEDEKGETGVAVRSGPDWSSFVSNWMTAYERTLDLKYRDKIETGVDDLKNTPFGLTSGPSYLYESSTGHLSYQGEDDSTGMHLQICMGGPEVWMETAEMLEDDGFKKLLEQHGRFYMMSREEKKELTKGLIEKRGFDFPYFAADIAAFAAQWGMNTGLAERVWKELLNALATQDDFSGFEKQTYHSCEDGKELKEIPWIKTNFAAQWCLNTIVALEFIREYLPGSMEEMKEMLQTMKNEYYHRS